MITHLVDLKCWTFKFESEMDSKVLNKLKKQRKLFLHFFLAKYNANLLISGNLNVNDAASLEIDDPFTKELIEIWSCLNFKKQPSDFSNIPVWYNSFVRIDNKPIYYKKLV